MGKNIGIILFAAGIISLLLIAVLVFSLETSGSGAILGFVLFTAVVALPLMGAGAFFFLKGRDEGVKDVSREKQRQLLSILSTRGQMYVTDLAIELDATRDEVKEWTFDLVGKGLFSGYVNWEEGLLYSSEAKELHALSECRNCGGNVDLAGKGVIRCPFCGTNYMISN